MYRKRPNRHLPRALKRAGNAPSKNQNTSNKTAGKNVDLIISRASSIAQIGTLLVAVFGYFYTVLPVFQNQKLQEDNAKLQLKNDAESAKLSVLLAEQTAIVEKSDELQKLLDERTLALGASAIQLKETKLSEQKMAAMANATALRLKDEVTSLDKARWKIAIAEFEQQTGFRSINQHGIFLKAVYEGKDFISEAESKWYDALTVVKVGLERAQKSNSLVPASYYLQIEDFLNGKSSQLVCEIPNFEKARKQFEKDMHESSKTTAEAAKAEIERQKIKAESEGKRLLVQTGDLENMERSLRIGAEYKIKSEYRERLMKDRQVCDELPRSFIKEIRQKFGATE